VSQTIGLDSANIVPTEDELNKMQEAAAGAQMGMAQAGAQAQGAQQGSNVTQDMGPRTNITGGAG